MRSDYKDNKDVLEFYEPSAIYIVNELENKLIQLIQEETGSGLVSIQQSTTDVDFWIRIEGEHFHEGKGPIGQVGAYLSKLNNANRNVISLIERKNGKEKRKISEVPSFNLVATRAGSLKLGLERPDVEVTAEQASELDMFYGDNNWQKFKDAAEQTMLAKKSLQVLVRAIASANNEEAFNQLKEEFNDKEVIKIIHFAKELVPSSRSAMDFVSIEGEEIGIPEKVIKTDKHTRKILSEYAKSLSPTTEYVEGTAMIGIADVNNKILTATPLKYNNIVHDEIRCFLTKPATSEEIKEYLNQLVDISGYIIHDKNDRLLRLEIDDIEIRHKKDE